VAVSVPRSRDRLNFNFPIDIDLAAKQFQPSQLLILLLRLMYERIINQIAQSKQDRIVDPIVDADSSLFAGDYTCLGENL
jgi:hypothetical protein